MAVALSMLKILGFLVLLVLGVLLLHLLLLLFVPLRYQLSGAFADKKGRGKASLKWMLGYLSADANVSDGGFLSVCCYVLGFQVWSYSKQLPVPGKKTESAVSGEETDAAEAKKKAIAEAELNAVSGVASNTASNTESDTESGADSLEEMAEQNAPNAKKPEQERQQEQQKQTSLFCRVKNQLKEELTWLSLQLKSAVDKLNSAQNKLDALVELLRGYRDFFLSEQHRETFFWIWQRLKRVLAELKPTGGNGELIFGTGDPYSTTQLLEPLAFLFPFYAGWLEVVPQLENKIFSFRLDVKGRIRIRVPAVAALQLYFSKNVKTLVKEFREMTEHG